MRYTNQHAKAGTTDVVVAVRFAIALDDPTKEGNMGREGADEDSEVAECATVDEGKAKVLEMALAIAAKPKHTVDHVKLTERRWTEDVYDDRDYGTIGDAISDDIADTYGYLSDGVITWDERYLN